MRIIVTGASGTLGSSVIAALRDGGHSVATVDRVPASLDQAPPGALGVYGVDLADASAASSAVRQLADEMGGVDGLVNVADAFEFEPLGSSCGALTRLFAANALTPQNMVQAVAPRLSVGGRIVNVGASAVGAGLRGLGPYAASKAAVMELTLSHAAELAPRGVTVNAVLPATLDTPRNRLDMPTSDPAQWTRPGAVADVVAFLLSPAARAVTGALIPVRGVDATT